MVEAFVPPVIITVIWAVIGIIGPFFARGPNRGLVFHKILWISNKLIIFIYF